VADNPGHSPPEGKEPEQEPREAPVAGTGASRSTDVDIPEPLAEIAKETIRTEDRHLGRREWTKRALIVGFFALFLTLFGVPSWAALQSDEPFTNVVKVVNIFAPLVTAIGGYIAGHYFPGQGPPQNPGGGGSSGR
jgi:hypothetical protein